MKKIRNAKINLTPETLSELKDMCLEVREKLKLSQRELAILIGSTQTEISFMEHGFIPLARDKIIKLYMLHRNA